VEYEVTVEYEVIESKESAQNLQIDVNERIQEGWEPVGGVAVVYAPQSMTWWYYQAMIKKPRDRRGSGSFPAEAPGVREAFSRSTTA
jgi:hypothetical protein